MKRLLNAMSKKTLGVLAVIIFIAVSFTSAQAYEALNGPTGLLKYDKTKAFDGYTVIPSMAIGMTYLVDMEGYIVHTWKNKYRAGLHAILLPNGNLLKGGRGEDLKSPIAIGGNSGIVQELDWDGNVVWEYRNCTPTSVQHHTFARMPNGNTLILAWEYKSWEEAIAKGRDPKTLPKEVKYRDNVYKGIWPDYIQEVTPAGKVVWEWHAWDHIGTGPNQLDINYHLPDGAGGLYPTLDWNHGNTVEYIPETDQVIFNSRNFSEFYLISHKTGAIEYRWGNPCASGQGECPGYLEDGDQILFGPHNVTSLKNGNILIFDNGAERPEKNRSRVVEMDPKTGKIVWQYASASANSFYTSRQGAAQRLPNGNTLITSSSGGHIFEVTKDKEVVWEFINPVTSKGPRCFFEDGTGNSIHRAYRYAKDYPAFEGKDLSNRVPFKLGCLEPWRTWNEPE